MKQKLIALVTFISGIYFVLEFLLPAKVTESLGISAEVNEAVSNGFLTVGAMAFGLGVISLVLSQVSKIAFFRKDWIFSLVMLLGLCVMLTVSSIDFYQGEKNAQEVIKIEMLSSFCSQIIKDDSEKNQKVLPTAQRISLLVSEIQKKLQRFPELNSEKLKQNLQLLSQGSFTEITPEKKFQLENIKLDLDAGALLVREKLQINKDNSLASHYFNFLNQGVFVPLGAAMFSLLGFYIAGAAFKAFRVRSFESSLMMISAVLVIAGQTSFTLRLWDGFSPIRDWLLQVPNSAAFRGITIGAGLAGLVLSIRILLSLESKSFKE